MNVIWKTVRQTAKIGAAAFAAAPIRWIRWVALSARLAGTPRLAATRFFHVL